MAGANVMEFTTSNWQKEVVESDKPVLVDFWAPWCGPCRQLGPIIDRLAEQFAGRVKIGKMNVDEEANQETAINYQISSIPALLVFKGGTKPLQKIVGLRPEAELKALLDQTLKT